MDKKSGLYILFGLLIGSGFGASLGVANSQPFAGLGLGALAGVFIGWFIAVIVLERDGRRKNNKE
jgi:ABC-type uncharacterized transport system permease subunit